MHRATATVGGGAAARVLAHRVPCSEAVLGTLHYMTRAAGSTCDLLDGYVVLQTGAKPNERRQCGERRDAVRAQVRRGAGRLWRGCAVLGKSRVVCRGCNLYRGSKFADDSLVLSAPRPRPADVAAVATGVAAPLDSTTSANGTGGTRAAIIHDPTALAELRGPFAAALTTGQTAPSGVVEVWGGRLCACKCGWPTLTG